ncbi:hypothetical protein BsWGS_26732 [Bradybaena similaris]
MYTTYPPCTLHIYTVHMYTTHVHCTHLPCTHLHYTCTLYTSTLYTSTYAHCTHVHIYKAPAPLHLVNAMFALTSQQSVVHCVHKHCIIMPEETILRLKNVAKNAFKSRSCSTTVASMLSCGNGFDSPLKWVFFLMYLCSQVDPVLHDHQEMFWEV